tara:strand:+ start:3037 stop:3282 length:246 start_codon:yes stop_codon:yes gene_type:complete
MASNPEDLIRSLKRTHAIEISNTKGETLKVINQLMRRNFGLLNEMFSSDVNGIKNPPLELIEEQVDEIRVELDRLYERLKN